MAVMFPDRIEDMDGATDGEKEVFHFLHRCANPSRDCLCWCQPDLNGLEPDFVLFSAGLGLLVLEVKDWAIHQIQEADTLHVTLLINNRREKRTNPDKQARGYVNALMDRLQKVPAFLQKTSAHAGKLRIPIARMVAFPNIGSEDYRRRGLHGLIPRERVFLKEDFDPLGEIHRDGS